jgi:hypothetical protein
MYVLKDMYVSMYACMYISMYVYMFTGMYIYICIGMHACIHIFLIYIYTCIYTCLCICTYIYICIGMHVCIYIFFNIYMCMYMYIYSLLTQTVPWIFVVRSTVSIDRIESQIRNVILDDTSYR